MIIEKLITKYGALAGIILFGAIVNAILRARDEESKGFGAFILDIVVAAFCGFIFALAASAFDLQDYKVYPIAGIGAFLSVKGVHRLFDLAVSRYEKSK